MVANLFTAANAVCGFAAIALLTVAGQETTGVAAVQVKSAAWCILAGMIFDVLDGRVARSTGGSSEFGAELDTLADLTTFGIAPAILVLRLHSAIEGAALKPWILWCFCIAYFLGAVLRLARFTAEHKDKEEETEDMCFKGLPTPAGGGVLASAAIVYFYLTEFRQMELTLLSQWQDRIQELAVLIPFGMPFMAGILGYTMISNRLRYVHVGQRYLTRGSFDAFAYLIFAIVVMAAFPEIALPCVFAVYLLSAPVKLVLDLLPWRRTKYVADTK